MTKAKIKIEVIHDVICSWCPVGYSNIKAALVKLNDELEADITFLPFEVNPEMPEAGESIDVNLMRRNGWNGDQWLSYRDDLTETATKAGLVYDFSKRTHYWNTAKAHTLIHYAEGFGKQEQFNQALVQGYFTAGMNVDDIQSLLGVAESVGLASKGARSALSSPIVAAGLQKKRDRVRQLNARSVPSFVLNNDAMVPGSRSADYFFHYFTEWLAKRPEHPSIQRVLN